MSSVEIYTFNQQGDSYILGRAGNAFGYALHIWQKLSHRYGVVYSIFDPSTHDALWDIAYRRDVSRDDRILMSATFDRTWVKKEHLPELIRILTAFNVVDGTQTIKDLIQLLEIAHKRDIIGIGIHGNSVSTHYWEAIREDDGTDERPFNFHRDLITEGEPHTNAHVELMWVLTKDKDPPSRQHLGTNRWRFGG